MCGGGVFFVPDITKARGDFSSQVVQVWNDGLSIVQTPQGKDVDEPGGCAGGAWHQVAPNNRILFRAVQGRNSASDNYYDKGEAKLVYDIDISPLVKSAQDGRVDCDLSRGIHTGGLDLTGIQLFNKLARGEHVADCPFLISALPVEDITSGGPHWGALDNHTIDQNGVPWRLTFSNYFVARTGVDGDHRFYNVDVAPDGKLSYDDSFRDEKTGSLGVNFNRRNWPGSPDAGFYKPHSELWVCPPGICTDDSRIASRAVAASAAASTCRTSLTITLGKVKGRKILGGTVSFGGKTLVARKSRSTGRWSARIDLRKVTASRLKVTTRTRVSGGRTVSRTVVHDRCPSKAASKKKATKKAKTTKKKAAPSKAAKKT
jgi:hypothetical protein